VLRRILWFVAGLLALAIVAAAIIPRDTTNTTPPPPATSPERTTVKADIGASPTKARTIPARVGDHLLLTVENDGIDTVNIAGLDETDPVDATTPAQFDTILDHPGRFQVKLQSADKVVGIIEVKPS
jgi:hypothetical protein